MLILTIFDLGACKPTESREVVGGVAVGGVGVSSSEAKSMSGFVVTLAYTDQLRVHIFTIC